MRAAHLQTGERLRGGAGGEDDVAAGQTASVDLDGVRRDEPAGTLDVVDGPCGDQPLEPLVEPGDDAVLVGVHTAHVDRLERGLDPEATALSGRVRDLGRVQQRLGGDAPHVQAGASQLALLDQSDAQAQLCGP